MLFLLSNPVARTGPPRNRGAAKILFLTVLTVEFLRFTGLILVVQDRGSKEQGSVLVAVLIIGQLRAN